MPLLINGKIAADPWKFLDAELFNENALDVIASINEEQVKVVFPIALYIEYRDQITLSSDNLGISLMGDDDLSSLIDLLDSLSLVVIDFPILRDGRGYSIARNVSRSGFSGEIRATGDVGFDRLDYMQRSGFNAFQVADDRYTEEIANAFTEISVNYQPTHSR